jgi:histidinol-phosphate phosphatase family protein
MITRQDNWTLFLDRDGVINKELPEDYVKHPEEFIFEPSALEGLSSIAPLFNRLIVVTNQRGVGAGLMTQEDLDGIHEMMLTEMRLHSIVIDKIYAATDKDRDSLRRKPRPYMGHQAKEDFPEIDFRKSVMVGNSRGDIEFGRTLGMITVFIDDKGRLPGERSAYGSDFLCASLYELSVRLQSGSIDFTLAGKK